MILAICTVAVVFVGVLSMAQPPRYAAEASIVPPSELTGGGGFGSSLLGGAEAALLRNVVDVTSVADLYVGILESRAVSSSVIDRFDLAHVYDVNESRYRAEKVLRKHTDISVSAEGIVSIVVEDEDPNRAAAMANAYVEELDRQNKRLSSGQATSKRVFLENRLKEIEAKFSRIESIPSHEAKVQEVLYELLIRECELAKIEEAKSMPTIQVLDQATPPESRRSRGTFRKVLVAWVLSFVLAVFLAFAREYIAQSNLAGRGSAGVRQSSAPRGPVSLSDDGPEPSGEQTPGTTAHVACETAGVIEAGRHQ